MSPLSPVSAVPGRRRLAALRATVPLLAAGVTLGLLANAPLAAADPTGAPAPSERAARASATKPNLTAAARRAHLQPGNATMGWYDKQASASTAKKAPVTLSSTGRGVTPAAAPNRVYGIDVASYQGNLNWTSYRSQGKQFAYVKATEGTSYRNPYFARQYGGSAKAGMIRGAYHFAIPSRSSGAAQADYFVARGGGWSRDGKTLPGVLDIEYNPYGSTCYGFSQRSMVSWINSFTTRYKKRTGRDAVIYTTADWWRTCTGNTTAFRTKNPLWVARYASSAGTLPGGWGYYTFWQYSGTTIDKDRFNGSLVRLRKLATG
ncbi:MAG: lysozyme [Propionibacteriaceae bacterium]